jgi:hypothetical protein
MKDRELKTRSLREILTAAGYVLPLPSAYVMSEIGRLPAASTKTERKEAE